MDVSGSHPEAEFVKNGFNEVIHSSYRNALKGFLERLRKSEYYSPILNIFAIVANFASVTRMPFPPRASGKNVPFEILVINKLIDMSLCL